MVVVGTTLTIGRDVGAVGPVIGTPESQASAGARSDGGCVVCICSFSLVVRRVIGAGAVPLGLGIRTTTFARNPTATESR